MASFTLEALWPRSVRAANVADIGAGGGSLLDHLRGVASGCLAIEPDPIFAAALAARGYAHFPSCEAGMREWASRIDVAFCIQVIEHVERPRDFLASIRGLLAPTGRLVLSTPNRNDILFDLLPNDFPAFFSIAPSIAGSSMRIRFRRARGRRVSWSRRCATSIATVSPTP